MKNSNFNLYSYYYDLLYKDKDYLEETIYIKNLLNLHGFSKGDILEFGSGTGKHGILLSNFGYSVHGIEISEQMLAIANAQNKKGFTCQKGDISLTQINKTFDVVVALFHVMSYQTTNKKLNMVFANASKHLKSGGLFIFDFWYSPAIYNQKPTVRIKLMSDDKIQIFRISEPKVYHNENKVDVNYTFFVEDLKTKNIKTFKELHPMRHFSLPELDFILNIHGFERLQTEELLTKKPASDNTWGVCMVLRKL